MADTPEQRPHHKQDIEPWETRGVADGIPIPSRRMVKHAEMGGLFHPDRKGLLQHCVSSLIVANTIVDGIEEANSRNPDRPPIIVDRNLIVEVIVAHCAVRHIAELAKKGQASEAENVFMQTHDDIEFATWLAIQHNLPIKVINGVESLQRSRGFPHKTIGPENLFTPGNIDWSVAITQYASWMTSLTTVTTLQYRFEDLAKRHAGTKSTKNLSAAEIEGYREWATTHLKTIAEHVGTTVEDFHGWLFSHLNNRHPLDRENMTQKARDQGLKESATEFIPLSPVFLEIMRVIQHSEDPAVAQRLAAYAAHPRFFLDLLVQQDNAVQERPRQYTVRA